MKRTLPLLAAGLAGLLGLVAFAAPPAQAFDGVFWQPDCESVSRITDYRPVGASTLVLQWTALSGEDFSGQGESACHIDWGDVQRRSGQLNLIVGLYGSYEPLPRQFPELARQSAALAEQLQHLQLSPAAQGYYAPVEVTPEWNAQEVRAYLSALPRPLWVSTYAGKGRYGPAYVAWLREAVPGDVHLMVQDGVGVGHATPAQAAAVVRQLQRVRGAGRVSVIMEVFRPSGKRFRSAAPWELDEQFAAYRGLERFAFDGGHYMNSAWLRLFRTYFWLRGFFPAASTHLVQQAPVVGRGPT